MANAVEFEEQRLDYKRVKVAELEVEKCVVFEREVREREEDGEEEMDGKKAEAERRKMRRRKVVVERNSLIKMIEAANALVASSMTDMEVIEPPKMASVAVIEQPASPTASSVVDIAELDACETAIAKPRSSTTRPSTAESCETLAGAEAEAATITATAAVVLPSARPTNRNPPISCNTALHSNLPSSSDLAHARNLTSAHLKRTMTRNAICERQTMGTQNAFAAFDMVTQYGTVGRRTKLSRYVSVARRTKLSVSAAVHRGFREVFR